MLSLFSKYYRSMNMEYMSLSYRVEKYPKGNQDLSSQMEAQNTCPQANKFLQKYRFSFGFFTSGTEIAHAL